jgi:hypothetical protein
MTVHSAAGAGSGPVRLTKRGEFVLSVARIVVLVWMAFLMIAVTWGILSLMALVIAQWFLGGVRG